MKKFIGIVLSLIMCISFLPAQAIETNNIDYIKLFGELINDNNGYVTKLEELLMSEYHTCDIAYLKDCYMVDMNNDSVPELICIFCDEWGPNEYAVLIEYDNGFKLGAEMPFEYNSGSAGSEYYRILKANGLFYYEKYFSARPNYDTPDGWILKNEIVLNKGGVESVVYSASSNNGINQVNGQQVDEIDYEYVHNNFEIVADGYNYGETWNGYQPQFGKDYAKFWDSPKNETEEITVLLNGEKIAFDQPPVIVDGRTLVPVRAVVEKMNGSVLWVPETQTVELGLNGNTIKLTIDSKTAVFNDEIHVLDVPPQIINARTLLPIRFIAEKFGYSVGWEDSTQTVIITSKDENVVDVTEIMSEEMKSEFNQFVCAEAVTAEVAPYNILKSYNCNADNDVRGILWYFVADYAGMYLKNIPAFKGFDNIEQVDYSLCRTPSWYWDFAIKEYYNISKEIPQFKKISDYGSGSLYYSNYYYFFNMSGRGASEYQTYIEKIYDLGDNRYYFQYKLGASTIPGSGEIDYMYDDTYYAVMERKNISNESFSNLEFWSVVETSTSPIITFNN